MKKNVLIGGIGNVLLSDDGVGPYIARLLASRCEFAKGVEVLDLGTPALELIDQVSSRDAVILVDSVALDEIPGTVLLYRKEDILRQGPSVRMDPHSPALVDALLNVELFGVGPADVLLIGIVGASHEPGCNLSAPVHAAVLQAVAQVLCELDRLDVHYQARPQAVDPDIWWASLEEPASVV